MVDRASASKVYNNSIMGRERLSDTDSSTGLQIETSGTPASYIGVDVVGSVGTINTVSALTAGNLTGVGSVDSATIAVGSWASVTDTAANVVIALNTASARNVTIIGSDTGAASTITAIYTVN